MGRKPGKRERTGLEIARDRKLIVSLKLRQHLTSPEIALEVNKFYDTETEREYAASLGKSPVVVSPETVRAELVKARQDYKDDTLAELTEQREELIRGFEDLEAYCWERYNASCTDKITNVEETKEGTGKDGDGTQSLVRRTAVNDDGDPRYLQLAFACKDKVAELRAAYPPKKTALTNPDGTEPFRFEGSEEFKRLAALATELLEGGNGRQLKQPAAIPASTGGGA